ncbi:hypothetical protein MRY87_01820 [bacterium]|nr:hypothetical protein [bacterium]
MKLKKKCCEKFLKGKKACKRCPCLAKCLKKLNLVEIGSKSEKKRVYGEMKRHASAS